MDEPFRVARPRVKRLSVQQEREVVRLLASLLADAAKQQPRTKPPVVIPDAFQRVKRGPMPGARPDAEGSDSAHGDAKRRASRSATKVGE